MIYVIKGDPVPLARARHSAYGVYDGQKELRRHHKIEVERQQVNGKILHHKPMLLVVKFFMRIPPSFSAVKRAALVGKPHYYKPDLSNMIKWIEDVANNIVYHDDCAISMIFSVKVYDEDPRTEFSIYPMEGNLWNEDRSFLLNYFISHAVRGQ